MGTDHCAPMVDAIVTFLVTARTGAWGIKRQKSPCSDDLDTYRDLWYARSGFKGSDE